MTNKIYRKLIAAAFLALIAISLMVTVSYAWYTLAGSPALAGVQITIGGSNTIKIAPDITKVMDGEVVHFPGAFEETLKLSQYDTYDYLEDISGLSPVSTADGIHWFLPNTEETAVNEQLVELDDFIMDDELEYANLPADDEKAETGNYVYLDFWVVAPMENCSLRVAGGYEGTGSYVIHIPNVVASDTEGMYELSEEGKEASACARIGFMTNTLTVTDKSMLAYVASDDYNELYKHLEGTLMEPGLNASGFEDYYDFTIYEPNGDLHTWEGIAYLQTLQGLEMSVYENGGYVVTSPIGMLNGEPSLVNISDRLAVQKTNNWIAGTTSDIYLSEVLQTYLAGKNLEDESEEAITAGFYEAYLQNQYASYLESAQFYKSTTQLYNADRTNYQVSPEKLATVETAGAVDDAVIVRLEKNVPTRIRMFVWLEGQDVDCVREASSGTIAIGLELAGSTQD